MINNYDFINKIIENYDGDKIMNKFIDNKGLWFSSKGVPLGKVAHLLLWATA